MTTIKKPTVRYDKSKGYQVTVGWRATVYPIDHPRPELNEGIVTTSKVLNIDGDTFETLNTLYVGE